MFEDSTFDSAGRIKTKTRGAVAASFTIQGIVLVMLALIPLIFTEALPARGFLTMLVAPPPPPPPPPAEAPRVRVIPKAAPPTQAMVQPRAIPRQIAIIEEAPSVLVGGAVAGAGVIGGVAGGALGGLISVVPPPPPPPPPPPTPQAPIRVGGQVQAAKLITQPTPLYPPLARQARIQGTVRLEAIINREGVIQNLEVVSGHPMLIQAALDAVRQWRYEPTLLNGVPVEVITTVDVNFTMR